MTETETTIEGFLQDVVEHPEDPSIWLILADYLEDREDPRGELVRLTWSLSYEPEHVSFETRQRTLQTLLRRGVSPVRPCRWIDGRNFVWIPPGTFNMGSEACRPGYADEMLHPVTISKGFWMSELPTTYAATGGRFVRFMGEDDLTSTLDSNTLLPTEAEWEYACRAGTRTRWHFGDELQTELVSQANDTLPTGFFPPNAWGLYHMCGLCWEPCQDRYVSNLGFEPKVDPCENVGQYRVIRGGSFSNGTKCGRSAARFALVTAYPLLGIRTVHRD